MLSTGFSQLDISEEQKSTMKVGGDASKAVMASLAGIWQKFKPLGVALAGAKYVQINAANRGSNRHNAACIYSCWRDEVYDGADSSPNASSPVRRRIAGAASIDVHEALRSG